MTMIGNKPMKSLMKLIPALLAATALTGFFVLLNASGSSKQMKESSMNNEQTAKGDHADPHGSATTNTRATETFRPEHVAFNLPDPVAAAKWYTEHLGMKVMRQGGAPTFTTFIADSNAHMMIELFHNADYPLFDAANFSHMSIHLAFMVSDIGAIKKKLMDAGAAVVEDITKTPSGDQVLMLRDPWGVPIQFAQRVKPMLSPTGIRLEHLALNVADSRKTAQWYVTNLGMKVVREGGAPTFGMFIGDSSDQMMLELYQNSAYPVVDFGKVSYMAIHFALMVDDVPAMKARLLKAGGAIAEEVSKTPLGDQVYMMREPSGFPLQLVHRLAPMLK
jgi:glyoxylase I family protein